MKTLSTIIDGQKIKVRKEGDEFISCNNEICKLRGNVYCCYTLDYRNCRRYSEEKLNRIMFGNGRNN